ncbi:MAG: outer membrane beta-barrel family protein, partial [Brumimicrobium sp.]
KISNMLHDKITLYFRQVNSNINVITGQMDYSKVFNEEIKLDFGIKNSHVTNESEIDFLSRNNGVWETDSSLFNQFDYKENIAASYAEISGRLNKFSYNIGFRYEWTVADGNSFVGGNNVIDRNYMNIFPNVQLTYDLSPDLVVGASYVSRINRPSYQDLDPFINFIDSLTSIRGNPQLLPSTSHAVDASLVYMEYASIKVGYTKAYNPIFLTVEQNPGTNTFSAITRNIKSSELYNISIVIPYELKWWTTFNSFGYTWNNYVYTDNSVPTVSTKPSLYVSLYNEFRIPKLFNIELTYEWTSPGAQGLFIMRPYQTFNASVVKDFLDKKLTARLSVFDATFTQIESGFYRSSQFYVDYNSRMDTRRVQLSLTWKFGKMKDQTLVGSSIDSEEKERIKE